MHMAGVSSEQDLQQARDVLIPLGEYFQIQVLAFLPSMLMVGRFSRLLWGSRIYWKNWHRYS